MLLDIGDVAAHLGVTERHIRRLVAERRIPFIKWGHLLRFDPTEIASWLDSMRIAPGDRVARPRQSRRTRSSVGRGSEPTTHGSS